MGIVVNNHLNFLPQKAALSNSIPPYLLIDIYFTESCLIVLKLYINKGCLTFHC